ncbi:MAG TPA: hypothetical protein VK674_05355 [Candidatus Limnocylindria bacterium]|nr:hypothetical protein [Candidatus Limnocylindria bacterium]
MIQFNLLPDVKLEYIKARRGKHLVMLVSLIATGVTVAITVFLFLGVNVIQKDHLNNLSEDIQAKGDHLKGQQDIDKILAVQSQLNSLNGLHDAKPAADRLGTYLAQVTPNEVSISELAVDFQANTMTFDGAADALKSVNEFIDTLKFTTYELNGETKNAFFTVVLASFDRSDGEGEDPASYQVTLSFDPVIFDIKQDTRLQVPNKITTRSVTERPNPLFQQQPNDTEAEEEGH